MSDSSEILKNFFKSEYHREKLKQMNCNSHKELLKQRIRFLKSLLDELDVIEKKLSDISRSAQGPPSASGGTGDAAHLDKIEETLDRLCGCESSIEEQVNDMSRLLKVLMLQCEKVADDIEEISSEICNIQNGNEISLLKEEQD